MISNPYHVRKLYSGRWGYWGFYSLFFWCFPSCCSFLIAYFRFHK